MCIWDLEFLTERKTFCLNAKNCSRLADETTVAEKLPKCLGEQQFGHENNRNDHFSGKHTLAALRKLTGTSNEVLHGVMFGILGHSFTKIYIEASEARASTLRNSFFHERSHIGMHIQYSVLH